MSITSNIKSTLPKNKSSKVEERSQTANKSFVETLMSTLITMEFDGYRTMHEHVIDMTNVAARLKLTVDENFLV